MRAICKTAVGGLTDTYEKFTTHSSKSTGAHSGSLLLSTTILWAPPHEKQHEQNCSLEQNSPKTSVNFFKEGLLLLNSHNWILADEALLIWSQRVQHPNLTSQTQLGFEIFDSQLLKAVSSFSSGMETITVSHMLLSVLWNSCTGELFFILLFSLTARKLGSSQRDFSTAWSDL